MEEEWEINACDLDLYKDRVLGEGEFGVVYLGHWRGMDVAVKEFHHLDAHTSKLMRNEFYVMSRLHHPNIIQLFGYTTSPFRLVMEYMSNGNIQEYMDRSFWVPQRTKLRFLRDVARGLFYLHKRKPSYVIHRDLKPTNLLLSQHLELKISDFGICKILRRAQVQRSQTTISELDKIEGTANVGSLYYMAPELLFSGPKAQYNCAIDIYSFGIVLYEIIESTRIHHDCTTRDELLSKITSSPPQSFLSFCRTPLRLRPIVTACLDPSSHHRPPVEDILYTLETILQKWILFC